MREIFFGGGSISIKDGELYHHGILGQKWGVSNGPPYPLSPESHSKSEKNAGYQKSIDKSAKREDIPKGSSSVSKSSKKGLSDSQKRMLKIGAAVAVTGIAVYGLYKSGAIDQVKNSVFSKGKEAATSSVSEWSGTTMEDIQALTNKTNSALAGIHAKDIASSRVSTIVQRTKDIAERELSGINSSHGKNNCVACSAVVELRARGMKDLIAKDRGDKNYSISELELLFPNLKFKPVTGASSIDDVYKKLRTELSALGHGARGCVTARFRPEVVAKLRSAGYISNYSNGHAFSFEVFKDAVMLVDGQQETRIMMPIQELSVFDPSSFQFARLDDLDIDKDFIKVFAE